MELTIKIIIISIFVIFALAIIIKGYFLSVKVNPSEVIVYKTWNFLNKELKKEKGLLNLIDKHNYPLFYNDSMNRILKLEADLKQLESKIPFTSPSDRQKINI